MVEFTGKPSGPGVSLWVVLPIMNSIPLIDIGLFRLFIPYWVSFGCLYQGFGLFHLKLLKLLV